MASDPVPETAHPLPAIRRHLVVRREGYAALVRPASDMPLKWHIDHQARLVQLTADRLYTFADFRAYFDVLFIERAMMYGRLFDMRRGAPLLTESDLASYAGVASACAERGPMGALAAVLACARSMEERALLDQLAAAPRPFAIFDDLYPALAWLREWQASPTE